MTHVKVIVLCQVAIWVGAEVSPAQMMNCQMHRKKEDDIDCACNSDFRPKMTMDFINSRSMIHKSAPTSDISLPSYYAPGIDFYNYPLDLNNSLNRHQ